jgi:hypothetical protein
VGAGLPARAVPSSPTSATVQARLPDGNAAIVAVAATRGAAALTAGTVAALIRTAAAAPVTTGTIVYRERPRPGDASRVSGCVAV